MIRLPDRLKSRLPGDDTDRRREDELPYESLFFSKVDFPLLVPLLKFRGGVIGIHGVGEVDMILDEVDGDRLCGVVGKDVVQAK